MVSTPISGKTVVVAGDVTMDWNFAVARDEPPTQAWRRELQTRVHLQPGGACLLAQLLQAVLEGDVRMMRAAKSDVRVCAGDPDYFHSTWVWSPHQKSTTSDDTSWRLREFRGVAPRQSPGFPPGSEVDEDLMSPALVVLDDAAFGFREETRLWPRSITAASDLKPWVILKTAEPVAQGKLAERLLDQFAERLIIVMTVGDIRLTDAQISSGLSWEASAQDLAWEFTEMDPVFWTAG